MEETKVAAGTDQPAGTAASPEINLTLPPPAPAQVISSTVPPPPAPAPEAAAAAAPPPPAPPPAAGPPAATPPAAPATGAASGIPGVSAPPPGFGYLGFLMGLPLSGKLLAGGGLVGVIGTIVGGGWTNIATYVLLAMYLAGPGAVWLLYQAAPNPMQKFMTWAIGQVSAALVGMFLIPVLGALGAGMISVLFSVSFFMSLASIGALALGSFLKAKEEKLF